MKALRGQLSDTSYILTSKLSLQDLWLTDVGLDAARICTHIGWVKRTEALMGRKSIARCAWPKEFLVDSTEPVGYVFINNWQLAQPLSSFLHQPSASVTLSWLHRHRLVYDLCQIVADLHAAGYVLSGVQPEHIGLNAEGSIAIANLDGLQFIEGQSLYLGCEGDLALTPPELVEKAPWVQTTAHDNFRLGILIYQILLGTHPYIGAATDTDLATRLREGLWLGNPRSRLKVPPTALPQSCLSHKLQDLFQQCFGATEPRQRPSCREWRNGLARAIRSLRQCDTQPGHYYSAKLDSCPWCDEFKALGTDHFAELQPTPAEYHDVIQPEPDNNPPKLELLEPTGTPKPSQRSGALYEVIVISTVIALCSFFVYQYWNNLEAARQAAEAEQQRQEELAQQAAEAEQQRQEELAQQAAEAERQRQEEVARQTAEAERQRQEELARQAAEAERQRQEEVARQAAEAERQREEELARQAAEAERQRQEEVARQAAEAERQRQEEVARQTAEAERQSNIFATEPIVAASVTEDMAFIIGNSGGALIRTAVPRNALPNQGLARITSTNGFGVTITDSNPGIFMYEQMLPPGQYNVQLERPGFCPYSFSFTKTDDIGVYNSTTGSSGLGIAMSEGC